MKESREEKKQTSQKQQNLSLILLSLFIVGLIISTFILSQQKYIINTSIIILTAFLIVIVLSRSFDSFSVGKILEISKKAEENKERADKLENELLKLLNINFQSQKTSNNVIIENSASKNLDVEKATKDEIEQNKTEEINEQRVHEQSSKPLKNIHKLDSEKLKTLVLKKYFGMSDSEKILHDVKVVSQFEGLDPISDKTVVFDAYNFEKEMFIAIRQSRSLVFFLYERLYIMLNKVYHYRKIKNTNAMMVLLVVKLQDDYDEKISKYDIAEKLQQYFSPAIKSNLMRIVEVDLSKEETEECYIKNNRNE